MNFASMFIDSHNHLHHLADPEGTILSMRDAGVSRCVVNAIREDEWPVVENLFLRHPDFILPAFGIHPWHAHTATTGWETRLAELLRKHPSATIGECGLDGWVESPPLEVQPPVFLRQLRLARELDRPLTIHCLKAWQPLFDAFAGEPPPRRFLMHSFGGSIEIARRLIPLGAWFSFSGHFLHPRKSKVAETFLQLPQDRLLLETDAPDMLPPPEFITQPLPGDKNHPANLPSIAAAFSGLTGIPLDNLSRITRENFRRSFL